MKRFKALIIEDQRGIALAITRSIKDLLLFSGIEIDFVYADNYEDAREKVMLSDYDIISIDGILGQTPTLNLIGTILKMHQKATVFFLSSSGKLAAAAKDLGVSLCFLKGDEQIIKPADLVKIKKSLTEKGIISYEVLYQELIQALLIFSESKAELELFNTDEPKYLQIVKILNDNEVNFAVVDRQAQTKIFVDGQSSQLVKKLAEVSCLEFWLKWSNEFHH